MRKRMRLFRVLTVIACGCSFQFVGCQSQKVGDIVAGGIKTTAVDVSTFMIESFFDGTFQTG